MGAVLFSRSIVVSKEKCFLNLELHNLSLRQNPVKILIRFSVCLIDSNNQTLS